ncbi:hypothetical protein FOH38_03670 [Lysinibacillus fusiformis]|nr:hypothetical protein FOH38_03670 [Lysinibacillus fusiformis]
MSWRFKRSNISQELEQAPEEITAFRKDKESGPAINQTSESIAFKFQQINRIEKQVILQIADVLQRYIR